MWHVAWARESSGRGVVSAPALLKPNPLPTPCLDTFSVCLRELPLPSPWLLPTWSSVACSFSSGYVFGFPLHLYPVEMLLLCGGGLCLFIFLCVCVYVRTHACTHVFGAEGGWVQSMSIQQPLNHKSLSHLSLEQRMTPRWGGGERAAPLLSPMPCESLLSIVCALLRSLSACLPPTSYRAAN